MAKKVSGTKKVDTITVNASNVIVVTGKKTETTPITKSGKNYIFGDKGNDIIFVKGDHYNGRSAVTAAVLTIPFMAVRATIP